MAPRAGQLVVEGFTPQDRGIGQRDGRGLPEGLAEQDKDEDQEEDTGRDREGGSGGASPRKPAGSASRMAAASRRDWPGRTKTKTRKRTPPAIATGRRAGER